MKKICIVEDKNELRDGMCMMINMTPGYELVGNYANAEDALNDIPIVKPNAVLMDINLPGASGIECVNILKSKFPEMLFLMCTAFEDNDKIFESLKAGASGYILKTEGPAKIIESLNEMFDGGSPMSSQIARKVVASFIESKSTNKLIQSLTDKESEVLTNLSKGMLNKEVANAMAISPATVRTHIQNIYSKLHVNTRVEAVNLFLKR